MLDDLADRSAAPVAVRTALANLVDRHGPLDEIDDETGSTLVAVLAASRSLTRVIEAEPATSLAVLADLDARPPVDDRDTTALVRWRNLEFLRIAARDLVGTDDARRRGPAPGRAGPTVPRLGVRVGRGRRQGRPGRDPPRRHRDGQARGWRAQLLQRHRHRLHRRGKPQPTRAAGPSGDGDRGTCFRIDANLRPEGRDGPLVRTIDSYEAYWDRWAEPWEFQALLKARPVAGDAALGNRWLDAAQRWLWARPVDAETLRSIRAMKQRTEAEVAKQGMVGRELKRGPGGIRDIEFTVQLLQLVHGHLDPALRGPSTLPTLAELQSAGYVDAADAAELAEAYRFLRTVEHRVQLVDEQQVHAIPAGRGRARPPGPGDGPPRPGRCVREPSSSPERCVARSSGCGSSMNGCTSARCWRPSPRRRRPMRPCRPRPLRPG